MADCFRSWLYSVKLFSLFFFLFTVTFFKQTLPSSVKSVKPSPVRHTTYVRAKLNFTEGSHVNSFYFYNTLSPSSLPIFLTTPSFDKTSASGFIITTVLEGTKSVSKWSMSFASAMSIRLSSSPFTQISNSSYISVSPNPSSSGNKQSKSKHVGAIVGIVLTLIILCILMVVFHRREARMRFVELLCRPFTRTYRYSQFYTSDEDDDLLNLHDSDDEMLAL